MSRARKEPIDALNLAAAATVVEREFRLSDFSRLTGRLAATDGVARARMAFRSEDGVATAELEVSADTLLTCQRCLGSMRQRLESRSKLAFVEHEDVSVPAECEVIAGDARRVDLAGLVEDELLLSLPLVPVHGAGEPCQALPRRAGHEKESRPPAPDMRRPFAGLKDLLKH
jgi:uncharacterized protein